MRTAQSSHLQNYEYEADSQTLTVTFLNGAVYQYSGVSFDDYNRMVQSGGSGTAFWAYIRKRYSASKIASGASTGRGKYAPARSTQRADRTGEVPAAKEPRSG